MTAQAVAPSLPPDPAPTPPPAPETGRGSHFLALLGGGSANAAPSAAAARSNAQASTVPAVTRSPAPRKPADTSGQANSGAQDSASNSSNNSDTTPAAIALPVPLLVQLQQPPVPIISAAAAATAPITAAASAVQPLPVAAASIKATSTPSPSAANGSGTPALSLATLATSPAALASAATSLTPSAAAPSPASASPVATPNPSGTATTALPGATIITDPASGNTPPLASTINARLANGAAVLVSQPRVALASLTPASDKPAAKVGASEGGLPTNARQLAALEGAHDAAEPSPAPATGHADQTPGIAKEGASTAASLLEPREPTAREQALLPVDSNPAADATNVPPQPPVVPASAPASQSETVATLPVVPHAVAEQVAINVHQAVTTGVDHIQIQLQPADLGAIDVKLNVNHDGRVTVVVSADRSDTLNLLQQDAGGLTQALRDAGLQADNSSLSFNLRGGFQFQQQQSAGSGGGSRDGGYPSDGDGNDVIAAPLPSLRRHAGALDIHV